MSYVHLVDFLDVGAADDAAAVGATSPSVSSSASAAVDLVLDYDSESGVEVDSDTPFYLDQNYCTDDVVEVEEDMAADYCHHGDRHRLLLHLRHHHPLVHSNHHH